MPDSKLSLKAVDCMTSKVVDTFALFTSTVFFFNILVQFGTATKINSPEFTFRLSYSNYQSYTKGLFGQHGAEYVNMTVSNLL